MYACIMNVCPMVCVLRNQRTTLGPHFPPYLRQNFCSLLRMPAWLAPVSRTFPLSASHPTIGALHLALHRLWRFELGFCECTVSALPTEPSPN